MKIKVIWDKETIGFLRKLDKKIASRIVKKVGEISFNYKRYVLSLVGKDYLKVRVGDYRLFVDIHEGVMIIRTIKHRRNAYKK